MTKKNNLILLRDLKRHLKKRRKKKKLCRVKLMMLGKPQPRTIWEWWKLFSNDLNISKTLCVCAPARVCLGLYFTPQVLTQHNMMMIANQKNTNSTSFFKQIAAHWYNYKIPHQYHDSKEGSEQTDFKISASLLANLECIDCPSCLHQPSVCSVRPSVLLLTWSLLAAVWL